MGERLYSLVSEDEYFTFTHIPTNKSYTVKPQKDGLYLEFISDKGSVGYCRWYAIVPLIGHLIRNTLVFDETRPLPKGKEHCPKEKRKEWNVTKVTKYWAKPLTAAWRKLLQIERYQKYIIFDKKYSRADGTGHLNIGEDWLLDKKHPVWTNEYLYRDAITYQPCMMLLRRRKYDKHNDTWSINTDWDYEDMEEYKDWKQCFAFGGEIYKALNKTLLSVNYPISLDILMDLRREKLTRPLLTRAEVVAHSAAVSSYNIRQDIKEVILKSSPKEFRVVAKYLRKNNIENIKLTKSANYYTLVRYLRDYDGETYHGSLLGLAKRSFTYHELLRQNRVKSEVKIDPATPTAKPPFDFSTVNGLKHLATVQDVIDEGRIMGHCVASYAKSAVGGHCYLFHIDHPTTNELATIEVGRGHGDLPFQVMQSQGPHNKQNTASVYAKKKLEEIFIKLGKEKCSQQLVSSV